MEEELMVHNANKLRVALVCVPWHTTVSPSLQCGILAGELISDGYPVDVIHANLDLACEMPIDLYETVANGTFGAHTLIGEWLFGVAAFGDTSTPLEFLDGNQELRKLLEGAPISFDTLCHYREKVIPAWLNAFAAKVDWAKYDIVGFSSTFEQNCAAIALACKVKENFPNIVTVFGGANYLPPMGPEFLKLDGIDYIVCGEGELAINGFLEALSAGRRGCSVSGVYCSGPCCSNIAQSGDDLEQTERPRDLDAVAVPNYDSYFTSLEKVKKTHGGLVVTPRMFLESARGCWW